MFLREAQFRRQVLAHQIAVQQRNRPAAHLHELRDQRIGNGRLA